MADLDELLIGTGVGPIHINRTRTVITPKRGATMPNGYALYNNLHRFMDARTASCQVDHGHHWNNNASLWFRGVPKIRPFLMLPNITIPVGVGPVTVPIIIETPESIKKREIPAWHTDHVGIVVALDNAVTVQTLKRNYETGDDKIMRNEIETTVVTLLKDALMLAGIAGAALARQLDRPSIKQAVAAPLVSHAIEVNQHHFLAGRRSFMMTQGSGGNWVFETAALERYSRWEFEMVTDYVMGGAPTIVPPLWKQMGRRVAAFYGTAVGETVHTSDQKDSFDAAGASQFWGDISSRHSHLSP